MLIGCLGGRTDGLMSLFSCRSIASRHVTRQTHFSCFRLAFPSTNVLKLEFCSLSKQGFPYKMAVKFLYVGMAKEEATVHYRTDN
jgi:hypothetical protein